MTQSIFDLFFHPGEIAEIRVLGIAGKHSAWEGWCKSRTAAGYFDESKSFEKAAGALDRAEPRGIYFTVNPINPDLLARSYRRIKADPKSTANDTDVACLRWLLVDLDPKHPAGISSSDAELKAAEELARAIVQKLEEEMGFSRAIRACSGNGYHLNYRIPDLENTEENIHLLRACLQALASEFDNTPEEIEEPLYQVEVEGTIHYVTVDQKVFNPARIWKLYGTTGRKGDSIPSRPHRRSYVFKETPQQLEDVPITPVEKLRDLAALIPKKPRKPLKSGAAPGIRKGEKSSKSGSQRSKKRGKARKFDRNDLGPLDVAAYLSHYSIKTHGQKTSKGGGTMHLLEECIFDPSHKREASIVSNDTPPYLTYQCFHNSCKGRTWKDARQAISGDDTLAPFCAGYDPNWQPPGTADPGPLAEPPPPVHMNPAASGSTSVEDPPLPPPGEIDPLVFFGEGKSGPVFVPAYMANYFARFFGPLVHTDGVFWRYRKGVWERLPKTTLFSAGTISLQEKFQPQWVDNAIKGLAGTVNREECDWPDCASMINCQTGMVDVKRLITGDLEGALVDHKPEYGSRCQVPVNFDPEAECERWYQFLLEIFPGDMEDGCSKQRLIQQFFGYCLLNDCRFQKALFLLGTGANGKSTLLNVLESLVGRENTSSLSLSALSQRFQTQFLQDKLVNLATETNTRDPLSTEIFKQVVAGDPVQAERKYGEPYTFRPYAKWIIAMNDIPVIPDKAYGLTRRLLIVDFKRRFEDHEQDNTLTETLLKELDGVFLWALAGLGELLANSRFLVDGVVAEESQRFIKQLNPLLNWVDECVVFGEDMFVPTKTAFSNYKKWCEENGYRKLGRNNWINQMDMHFPQLARKKWGTTRAMSFVGMGLLVEDWTTRTGGAEEEREG